MFNKKTEKKTCLLGETAIRSFKMSKEFALASNIVEDYVGNGTPHATQRLKCVVTVYNPIKYGDYIELLIREKYTVNEELAILRQRDTKPDEFAAYNTFVEECKQKAKDFVNERDAFYLSKNYR